MITSQTPELTIPPRKILRSDLLFVFIVFILIPFFVFYKVGKTDYISPEEGISQEFIKNDIFRDEFLFNRALNEIENTDYSLKEPEISSALIPHHLIASSMIADLMRRLKKQEVKTIFLLGPNHFENGDDLIITSYFDWDTEFGLLRTDRVMISQLIKDNPKIGIDNNVISAEHSIGNLISYIKFILPEARIVPIILKRGVDAKSAFELSGWLAENLRDNDIVISSVDFSHLQISSDAEKKDEETLKAIKNFDYTSIYNFDNTHLDSPVSLIVLMKYAQTRTKQIRILNHTNSGLLTNNSNNEVTSYFSFVYY